MMYLCLTDHHSAILVHQSVACEPTAFLETVKPYMEDLVVSAECIFCWYWLADLCEQHGIKFVLAHALYLKAIHGAKTKNDRTRPGDSCIDLRLLLPPATERAGRVRLP